MFRPPERYPNPELDTLFGDFCALEPVPMLELEVAPQLEPELKPVPVLELELGVNS